jgi:hypothetical protein
MSNRSPRHLKPGQRNLRGRKKMTVCRCCDPIIDHRDEILRSLHNAEMAEAAAVGADIDEPKP